MGRRRVLRVFCNFLLCVRVSVCPCVARERLAGVFGLCSSRECWCENKFNTRAVRRGGCR